MMGLIGQGCEHGDVLEVTGTNTPTQKNTPSVFHVWATRNVLLGASVCRKKKNSIVFVFVVQCLTQHTVCTLLGCGGGLFQIGFVLVVLASRVRPVPFRSR